ncbi:hypothetical protein HBH70_110400 [Parastagonospora nodorum]|uniref:Uncharacterized protein n=1 Tax=Phaeosphaeria nodorum (strain SN15 / ATCC MYA-4574 / FGSC 10173) TaxID=321614 RepID=A0A7U2FH07_PHANO|nr:hypothetical protein HBH54_132800 [Parastagonospora nodorum]QRD05112.1 hypothetical protein JI435_444100 [Parastagonospora nodorum SN15]KAH4024168.1 hypothetical protein HBI13_083830 [Parastagonospora nodorum]KAH4033894.1 hypothetical protein HBI09_114160 [Parastagonospora nodorum]KAH4072522.1 hypothetical protein HBH50_060640 [Parastagonospora nodorum]
MRNSALVSRRSRHEEPWARLAPCGTLRRWVQEDLGKQEREGADWLSELRQTRESTACSSASNEYLNLHHSVQRLLSSTEIELLEVHYMPMAIHTPDTALTYLNKAVAMHFSAPASSLFRTRLVATMSTLAASNYTQVKHEVPT